MPHISKKKLQKNVYEKLFRDMVIFISPKNKKETSQILNNLFTDTEQVMFTKRLAAILMIAEGLSLYKISETLELSTSTVDRMRKNYKSREYEEILEILWKRKKAKEDLWDLIGRISRGGLPPMGKHRWRSPG